MGLFSSIGKGFDKAMSDKSEQQKLMEQRMQQEQGGGGMAPIQPMGGGMGMGMAPPQSSQSSPSGMMGGLMGGVGGASAVHQYSQPENQGNSMGFMSNFGPLMSGSNATPQQQKDFRMLEQTLVESCAKQCLKHQRNYHHESELCQAKCYDIAFVYTRFGLSEIQQFAYENGLKN